MSEFMEHRFDDLTVRIDREQCIGSANCVKVTPQVFELDGDQIVRFRSTLGSVAREQLIEACDVCPVDALFVFDGEGNQIVP